APCACSRRSRPLQSDGRARDPWESSAWPDTLIPLHGRGVMGPCQPGRGEPMPPQSRLPFEKEIQEMEELLARLEARTNTEEGSLEEVRRIRRELISLKRRTYANLSAWDTVQVARHPERPQSLDYLELIFEEFVELHGDRAFGDDRAVRSGFARLGDFR